jgi:hypothetical protein
MKRFLFAAALSAVSAGQLAAGTAPSYENFGTLTNVPQIDARVFANYGTFGSLVTPLPFQTQNTLIYTNRGIMLGGVGFRFDFLSSAGVRKPADTFVNANSGVI